MMEEQMKGLSCVQGPGSGFNRLASTTFLELHVEFTIFC